MARLMDFLLFDMHPGPPPMALYSVCVDIEDVLCQNSPPSFTNPGSVSDGFGVGMI